MARPYLKLKLTRNGKSVDLMPYITSIEYSEDIDDLDTLDVDIFMPGNAAAYDVLEVAQINAEYTLDFCEVSGGSESITRSSTGVVKRVTYNQSPGVWNVSLTGQEILCKLKTMIPAPQGFTDYTTFLKFVAGELGFSAKISNLPTEVDENKLVLIGRRMPGDKGVANLGQELEDVLEALNFVVDADHSGKSLTFRPRNAPTDTTAVELTWGLDVMSLNVSLEDGGKVNGEADAAIYDYLKNNMEIIKAEAPEKKDIEKIIDDVKKSRSIRYKVPDHVLDTSDTKAMQSWLKMQLATEVDRLVQGTASCIGVPAASRDKKLKILQAGWPFTGSDANFIIKRADHTQEPDQGYTTSITFFAAVPPEFKKP